MFIDLKQSIHPGSIIHWLEPVYEIVPFFFLSCYQLITVYTVPGMDPDWLVGERGNQKGKVPVTYLELLS